MPITPFNTKQPMTPEIKTVFDSYDPAPKAGLLILRDLILTQAQALPQTKGVAEVLRWGQPSYVTPHRKSASTLRIGLHKSASFAIFAHCQSHVITNYASRFPGWDKLDGNRAVLFDDPDQIEPFRLATLIRDALTYHLKPAERPDL